MMMPQDNSIRFVIISSDENGNLYVSDSYNSRIQVLSNGGEFLRLFGCDENGVNRAVV